MTWLYIPNIEPLHSAPEQEGSNLASSLPDPERAASLTWRGKHMRPAHWSRAWKRDSWLRRLSGLTLQPSMLDRGAAAFIASLPEIHARRTVSPESGLGPPEHASSPPKLFASPTSAGLIVSSGRTSRGMRTDSSKRSSLHWSDWATALRLEYSARPASEEHTEESVCLSWPPPMAGTPAQNGNSAAGNSDFSRNAMALAEQWMTPNVPNGGRSATHAEVTGKTAMHNGKKVQIGLEHQARQWPTPTAINRVRDEETMAKCAAFRKRNANQNTVPLYLEEVALRWASPCARDWRGSGPATVRSDGKSRMDMLDYQAERGFQSLHRAQPIDAGPTSSPERRTLNPLFVEYLMGWPIGWTDCGCAEMEFTRWQQDMRGLLSTLCSRTPRQATLL